MKGSLTFVIIIMMFLQSLSTSDKDVLLFLQKEYEFDVLFLIHCMITMKLQIRKLVKLALKFFQ